MIWANDHPRRLLRTCPRWRGLLVLGEEYSIITSGLFSVTDFSPNFSFALMSFNKPTHAAWAITRLRKPFTTLKSAIALQFFFKYSPISCAVSSGFLCEVFSSGKVTSVRFPSKSLRVFCSWIIFSGTSTPYNSLTAARAAAVICASIFIFIYVFILFAKLRKISRIIVL